MKSSCNKSKWTTINHAESFSASKEYYAAYPDALEGRQYYGLLRRIWCWIQTNSVSLFTDWMQEIVKNFNNWKIGRVFFRYQRNNSSHDSLQWKVKSESQVTIPILFVIFVYAQIDLGKSRLHLFFPRYRLINRTFYE